MNKNDVKSKFNPEHFPGEQVSEVEELLSLYEAAETEDERAVWLLFLKQQADLFLASIKQTDLVALDDEALAAVTSGTRDAEADYLIGEIYERLQKKSPGFTSFSRSEDVPSSVKRRMVLELLEEVDNKSISPEAFQSAQDRLNQMIKFATPANPDEESNPEYLQYLLDLRTLILKLKMETLQMKAVGDDVEIAS